MTSFRWWWVHIQMTIKELPLQDHTYMWKNFLDPKNSQNIFSNSLPTTGNIINISGGKGLGRLLIQNFGVEYAQCFGTLWDRGCRFRTWMTGGEGRIYVSDPTDGTVYKSLTTSYDSLHYFCCLTRLFCWQNVGPRQSKILLFIFSVGMKNRM